MTAPSRELAEFVAAAAQRDLPSVALADAHRAVLDWLGSAMAGSLEPPARMAQRVVARLGSSTEATVFAAGRASAAGAALANGVASHILELDDVHRASTLHAGAPVISAALAVAERVHADGNAFLRAVTLGYEAALRVGEAVNPSHYRFWHPTGTAATFGAAAAAGSLIGLSSRQMLDAFGTAGTQAAGLWEFNADGSMSKFLHPGKAAFNGILAADLACEGFTGASRILEGDRGFFRAMSESHDASRVTDGLGSRWKISENCYKVWACCAHTHTAVDVVRQFRAQRGWREREAVSAIRAIDVETYATGYAIVGEMNPTTPYAAKFSLAYAVAVALLFDGPTLNAFPDERFGARGVTESDIAALLGRTTVRVADDLTARYPSAWPTRVRVTLADGTVLNGAADFPVGNPENPVSTEHLKQKFNALVAPRCGDDIAAHAIGVVDSLGECADISTAFSELGALRAAAR